MHTPAKTTVKEEQHPLILCSHCGNDKEEAENYDGKPLCSKCLENDYFQCSDCDEVRPQEGSVRVYRGDIICESCYNDSYFTCIACDRVYHTDDYGSNDVCQNCESHDEDHAGHDIDLSKFIDPSKDYAKIKTNLPIGVEIEAEGGNFGECAEAIRALNLGCGVSTDGSLDSTGIEIQTAPAALADFKSIVNRVCSALQNNGYNATQSCGLHCHIGLNGSTFQHMAQIVKTYSVMESCLFLLVAPSRRSNRYCHPLNPDLRYGAIKNRTFAEILRLYYANGSKDRKITYGKNKYNYKRFKDTRGNERYDDMRYFAFNLHSYLYRNTIEFRLHHGSTQPAKIINWATLLLAIINWARNSYNENTLDGLDVLPAGEKKINTMFNVLGVPEETKKAMRDNFKKYNR